MTKHKRKESRSRRGFMKALVGLGVGSIFSVVLIRWERSATSTQGGARPRGLPFYASEDEAKPFPETLDPALFPTRYVSHAYRVAKEIPGVLVQQPCYCECRSYKHRSLLSCYTSNHAAG